MRRRWRFVDNRYLSISFACESVSDLEAPWPLTVWISGISVRPISIIRIAVVWLDLLKYQNFVFFTYNVPGFSYRSDISETDEGCEYPLPNSPPFSGFALFFRGNTVYRTIRTAELTARELYIALKATLGLPVRPGRRR